MLQVDFLISNNGHHTAMFQPVIKALAAYPNSQCRVISLSQFRGLPSPAERFQMKGVEFIEVLPVNFRSSPATGRQTGRVGSALFRGMARKFSWYFLLRQPLHTIFSTKPELVVLPNDSAFPYDHIVHQLKARQIPFLLVQEGIRFPLPASSGGEAYGQGGAVAIAAWGENSATYFRNKGVPKEKIYLTGSPRFDVISTTDWQPEADRLKTDLKLGSKVLLFLSNPIDDQGFCTTSEKLDLIRRFITGIGPLFTDPAFHLVVKLHSRESIEHTQALISGLSFAHQITISKSLPLYPLFKLSQAAVVLASTVGLEALLFQLPLGVLEIPGTGFVYDYVSKGAAQGLNWQASMADQVQNLIVRDRENNSSPNAYLSRSLATQENATGEVMTLIKQLIGGHT